MWSPRTSPRDWSSPLGTDPSDYGAWYTLALAVGATWLAVVLIIDAVVSPSGTGIVYVGTSARLTYALGEESELPGALSQTSKKGVPVTSILLAAVVGELCFGPFPSWNRLVGVVTGATALMYAFAPVSLAALQGRDAGRVRSYRMPMPKVLLPTAFVSANLILYWGGFEYTWKIAVALVVGLVIFGIGTQVAQTDVMAMLRPAMWIGPWIAGCGDHRRSRTVRRGQPQLAPGVDRPAGRHRVQPGDLLLGGEPDDAAGQGGRGDRQGPGADRLRVADRLSPLPAEAEPQARVNLNQGPGQPEPQARAGAPGRWTILTSAGLAPG